MESGDFYESAVTSSLLYAKKNPPSKQSILLNIAPDSSVPETQVELPAQVIDETILSAPPISKKVRKKIITQSLQNFYPEIPPPKDKTPIKKKSKKKRPKSRSKTKQLLLEALDESKQEFKVKKLDKKSSSKGRMTRKQRKEYEQKKTIKLTNFIPKSVLMTREVSRFPQARIEIRKSAQSPLLEESDLYPFTNLIEWLIWHQNFPELAYVREAYDLDAVPQGMDEVYWINVMNEPEFFTSNWKVAGSRIYDLEGVRTRGPPGGEPEFNMDLVLTESGFSTLFSDVHTILTKMPDGLKNFRYPILQLALKGLLLLELAFIDENLRWYALGSEKDLERRLTVLDEFIGEQESDEDYIENVKRISVTELWQTGIISFDLLIMKSMFMSTFSRSQISEEIKIEILRNNKFQQRVKSSLTAVEKLDKLRVKELLQQLLN